MFRDLHWAIFRSRNTQMRRLYRVNHKYNNVNHKIGYMYLKFNEIPLSFICYSPIICFYFKPPLSCFHVIIPCFRLLMYVIGKFTHTHTHTYIYIYISFYGSHYFIYDSHTIVSSIIYLVIWRRSSAKAETCRRLK